MGVLYSLLDVLAQLKHIAFEPRELRDKQFASPQGVKLHHDDLALVLNW